MPRLHGEMPPMPETEPEIPPDRLSRWDYAKEVLTKHWREADNLAVGLFSSTAIERIGREISEREDLRHPQGLDEFEQRLRELHESTRRPNVLIAANHPDFRRARMQSPLWITEMLARIGRVLGKDPYTFVSGTIFPDQLERIYPRLLIVERDRRQPLKNIDILRRAMEQLRADQSEIFFIFPEGQNEPQDALCQAQPAGVSAFVNAARKHGVPLSILPVALEQQLVSRGESPEHDEYLISTGAPIDLEDLPKTDKTGSRSTHQQYADFIMRRIAAMLPENKRGYYRERATDEAAQREQ